MILSQSTIPLAAFTVALQDVGWDNLHAVLALDVDPLQQAFVAANAVSIAGARRTCLRAMP